MHTFSSVLAHLEAVPLSAAWLLEEIAEKRGHQDLFTRQSPEQLKRLREHAMIESAVASNRIEGVEVDHDRVGTILFGNGIMRDRDEEEVRGYRKALDLIHTEASRLPISAENICRLHALSRPSIWDSGAFRQKKCEIIQTYADGTSRVRFTAVAPEQVNDMLAKSIDAYENTLLAGHIPPLIAVAAFNLDFLCSRGAARSASGPYRKRLAPPCGVRALPPPRWRRSQSVPPNWESRLPGGGFNGRGARRRGD